jgi:hypothetical protein
MRRVALGAAAALALALPAAVIAKQTADFEYQSHGTAVQPGAVVGLGTPGSYEDFPFTIAGDDQDGAVTVGLRWANVADDWDLYVYRKNASGGLDQVASSAQGTTTEEQATIQAQTGPVTPGDYVIRVQNYASSSPDFSGSVKFAPYTPPNEPPKAKLKVKKRAVAGRRVKIDATKSSDADGKVVRYLFDLDGDGSMELDNGGAGVIRRKFSYGLHHIGVRVVDDDSARSYASATIAVQKPAKKKRKKR